MCISLFVKDILLSDFTIKQSHVLLGFTFIILFIKTELATYSLINEAIEPNLIICDQY